MIAPPEPSPVKARERIEEIQHIYELGQYDAEILWLCRLALAQDEVLSYFTKEEPDLSGYREAWDAYEAARDHA